MNDTLEFILVVLVLVLFYWFAISSTIYRILSMSNGKIWSSETIPLLLAAATFIGTTIWGILAIIFGNGYSNNPIEPFPPIALLSSIFAIGVWSLSTIIIFTYNRLFSLWAELKDK